MYPVAGNRESRCSSLSLLSGQRSYSCPDFLVDPPKVPPEKQNQQDARARVRVYVQREREIENYFRELALVTVGTGKSEIYGGRLEILVSVNVTILNLKSTGAGQEAGNSGRVFVI